MEAIVFTEITKQFQGEPLPAVDHIDLQVSAGNLVVLLGPSGCGKTTLLKMTNRLYEPTGGNIQVDGTDIQALPVTQLRRRIGYVIQQVGLFPHMTIAQNIAIVPELLNWDRQKINDRIDALLETVALPDSYRQRFPRQLSGGEQQRVGLARALAADPSILLMDEPFAALDAITRRSLQDELIRIQQKLHKTILFVTHDVEEAMRLADKIAVLQAGRLVQFGDPLEIVTRPKNKFVYDLVGSGDMIRRLSLLDAQSLLELRERDNHAPAAPNEEVARPAISEHEDLRNALCLLLESGASEVNVLGSDGRLKGQIRFDDLRQALFPPDTGS